MSTETVTGAVARKQSGPMAIVDQSTGWLAGLLPSHVDPRGFVGMAKAHLKKDVKLFEATRADPSGYIMALTECARLGLVPGDTFHIVPFKRYKNREFVGHDFVGIVDYTGEIELIYRAGAVSSVKAEIVYQADVFQFSPDMDRPLHKPDWFTERGEMIGVYAYAVMKDGSTSRVVVMNKAEVLKIKAVSKTAKFDDSPWKLWEDRMWLKSAIHQLSKWVPTSAEYRREQLRAAVEADNLRAGQAIDVTDAEIVGEPGADDPPHHGADETPGGTA